MLHAKVALANPQSCVHYCQLCKSTLERRVTFLHKALGSPTAWEDPKLSEATVSPASRNLEGVDLSVERDSRGGSRWWKLFP